MVQVGISEGDPLKYTRAENREAWIWRWASLIIDAEEARAADEARSRQEDEEPPPARRKRPRRTA
jgi:hypothetical protein